MTNLEMNQNIADFIGCYCSKWSISASKFAEKCGISYMTIKRILSCNVQKIDVFTVARIAQATGASMMEIINIDHENLTLYKKISYATAYDKNTITAIMDILAKLHISGKECREIPWMELDYDRNGFLLDTNLLHRDGLDISGMEKLTFRSTFANGIEYLGFRLPNNTLHPHYLKGNILLIAYDEPQDGDIGVYAWKDQGYIRLIFRRVKENGRYTELLPINNRGRKYRIDNDNVTDLMNWVKIGVVVGIIR